MSAPTTYSIYVRFRDRRLPLLKHIRSLETARASLRALRADRFHDADQVFLVNDRTKEVVNETDPEARETAAPAGGEGGRQGEREQEASRGAHVAADLDRATATDVDSERDRAESDPAPTAVSYEEDDASYEDDARPPSTREPLGPIPGRISASTPDGAPAPSGPGAQAEPPVVRLRRAMAAARSARARHAAALSAVLALQPSSIIDGEEILRLEASARESSRLSARALAELEDIVSLFDRPLP